MPEQVDFINRENELALIDKLVNEIDSPYFVCINAGGGIGKTRLLQEVCEQYPHSEKLQTSDIIDFDDNSLYNSENLAIRIAQALGGKKIFTPFLRAMDDYRKMQRAGISHERLADEFKRATQLFVEDFNIFSSMRRVIILFDTIEKSEGTDCLQYMFEVFVRLNNFLCLMSGRNADKIGKELQSVNKKIIQLFPLEEKASAEYLQKKIAILHIQLEREISEKILLLSGGKPIIIDLSVELLSRDIPKWLFEYDIASLSEQEKKILQEKFERQLVSYIVQTRSQMEILFLIMSHIYPLDIPLISIIFNISEHESEKLFNDTKSYVFVKSLPDKRITLHDEMRRMINAYVWNETDPNKDRRRKYSKLVTDFVKRKIQSHVKQIENLKEKEENKRVALEREVWSLKAEYLKHSLFINIDKGVETFIHFFENATRDSQLNFLEMLIIQIQEYIGVLSDKQRYEVDIRQVKNLLYRGKYKEAKEVIEKVLEKEVKTEKHVDLLIEKGNIEIRLGNYKDGIDSFEKAVKFGKEKNLSVWHIKSLNGLGWAFRLTGDIENATKYYHKARRLCQKEGGLNNPKLRETYNWISNNLAFVLSYSDKTCRTAIDMITLTIDNWKSMGNIIGEGAAHLVLGIAYYRSDVTGKAFEAFQKAFDIFRPLKYNDWLGQIYSWRGALFQNIGNYDDAKEDLEKSLNICSLNIRPMTLNRLARVYMSLKQWDEAEKYLKESLKIARQLPDSMYWLGAIERLAIIASEKGEYQRLSDLDPEFKNCLKEIEHSEKNSLGMAYISLARLALGQNDIKIVEKIVTYLKEGIPLLVEYSTYARTGILRKLDALEKDFDRINPEIICAVGEELQLFIADKEIDDVTYSLVSPIMYKWANWKGQNRTNEKE